MKKIEKDMIEIVPKKQTRLRPGTQAINIENFPIGERSNFYVPIYEDAAGNVCKVPFIVARGKQPGPVLGISAVVHGNELNGIRIIQNLLHDFDLDSLSGSLLCAPIVNIPAFNAGQRKFIDGVDLNHVFPGKRSGQPAQQYARAFASTFLPACNYLIDIHTASEGRTNSMYVRTDLLTDVTAQMATWFNPQILLHSKSGDGTLRNTARSRGIPAVTIEAGNPSVLQGRMLFEGEIGIENVMRKLGMIEGELQITREPVICKSSKWLRTIGGGLLRTRFKLFERVNKGQVLAETLDPFGNVMQRYRAPNDGIVIGMAANPVAIPGTRFCHLGFIGMPEARKAKAKFSSNGS